MYNLYGPTETTIDATYWRSQPDSTSIAIGRPIANLRAYVLDVHQQPVPIGNPGELYLAGAGLARGYLNQPDLTTEKYSEINISGHTERLYQTGDLVRWLPDGNLESLGRIDHQIKLRGFRIELGEIEAVLRQYPQINEAAVEVRTPYETPLLAAYITLSLIHI